MTTKRGNRKLSNKSKKCSKKSKGTNSRIKGGTNDIGISLDDPTNVPTIVPTDVPIIVPTVDPTVVQPGNFINADEDAGEDESATQSQTLESGTDTAAKSPDDKKTLYGNFVDSVGALFSGKGKDPSPTPPTTGGKKSSSKKCKKSKVYHKKSKRNSRNNKSAKKQKRRN